MKHLKEYDTTKIEELSDYLQELFDRYGLKEVPIAGRSSLASDIIDNLPCWCLDDVAFSETVIDIFVKYDDKSVIKDLNKIKPLLQRRMNQEIYIKVYNHTLYTYIKIALKPILV